MVMQWRYLNRAWMKRKEEERKAASLGEIVGKILIYISDVEALTSFDSSGVLYLSVIIS